MEAVILNIQDNNYKALSAGTNPYHQWITPIQTFPLIFPHPHPPSYPHPFATKSSLLTFFASSDFAYPAEYSWHFGFLFLISGSCILLNKITLPIHGTAFTAHDAVCQLGSLNADYGWLHVTRFGL